MIRHCRWANLAVILALSDGALHVAHAASKIDLVVPAPVTQCETLAKGDFSTIQDAPTQLTEATTVSAHDTQPAYCKVQGYVAPQVGFELRLPLSTWNGKFIEIGCGGECGHLDWAFWCPTHRGYACIVTDMGHKGKDDGLWAYNNLQAQVDFGYRATHVAALAGKAIVKAYYGRPPSKSMMFGCSTGGYQGMVEAQRFPWDFDGIVAIAPDMNSQADQRLRLTWQVRQFYDQSGKPILDAAALSLLHTAVLEKCDLTDGVKDGIIGDPVGCRFDPVALACKRGSVSNCLSSEQVGAARRIYQGPTTSSGVPISSGGVLPGSELNWRLGAGTPMIWTDGLYVSTRFFRYMFTPYADPKWKLTDFDFDRDYQRLGLGAVYSADNPDLRNFKKAGGKLLVAQGSNDVPESSGAAITDYYRVVERVMGGREGTADFFRLFIVPGMDHCTGGDGAFAIDYLSYLEQWVEEGNAPDKMIGAHVEADYLISLAQKASPDTAPGDLPAKEWAYLGAFDLDFPLGPTVPITFTRPVYPYPLYAKYSGTGDSKKAENFEAVHND